MNYSILKKSNFAIWRIISLFSDSFYNCATTLFSSIYMPAKYFNGELSETRKAALLLHEMAHVEQWQTNEWSYIFGWLFSKEQRRKYEMAAYEVQIRYLHSQGEYVDVDAWAKMINSLYGPFEFISVDEAKVEIKNWINGGDILCQIQNY